MANDSKDVARLLESYSKIESLNKKILDQEEQKQILHEKEKDLLEEGATEFQVQLELLKKQNSFFQDSIKSLETLQQINDTILDTLTKKIENQITLTQEEEKALDIALERKPILEEELKTAQKIANVKEKNAKSTARILADSEKIKELTEATFGKMFGFETRWKGTMVGKLFEGIEKGKLVNGFKSMGSSILSLVNPMNLLGVATTNAFYEMYTEQEKARAEFVKTTGIAQEYDKMITTLGHGHIALGIDEKDATESIISLRDGFSSYVTMTKEAQEETALFVASMGKLGIDTRVTTKNIEIATKVMGMNAKAAEKTQREIFALAQSIGTIPSKMALDFQNAAPRLAAHGEKMGDVFKKLSVVAKRTGMDMNELLGITDQFDTFGGAAESVGKLNAILGGPFLDSMQMVYMDEEQRIEAIRNAVTSSGLSFESMGRFQKKAVASAMGLKDVNQLSQLLSGNIEDVNDATKQEAITQEKMNQLIRDARPLMEKMLDIMKQLSSTIVPAVTKLADGLGWLLEKLNKLGEMTNGWLYRGLLIFGGGLLLIKSRFLGLISLTRGIIGFFGSIANGAFFAGIKNWWLKGSIDAVDKSQKQMTENMGKAGKTAGTSAIGMLAFGGAILMIGAGIFLVVYGISLLAESIKGMTTGEMVTLGIIFGVLLASIAALIFFLPALGAAATLAAPGLLVLGAAVLMIGAAITGILWGVSKVIEAIANLGKTIGGFVDAFIKLLDYIRGVGVIGMAKIALELTALGVGMMALAPGLAAMSIALALLPDEKSITFTKMIKEVTSISADKVENVKRLVDQADRYTVSQIASKNIMGDNVDKFTKMIEASNKTTPQVMGGEKQPIILELDGRVIKRFVIDVLDSKLNPRKV